MSTSERRLRHDGGFSLIEIVVTMGLIAVVLTASVPALVSMLRSTLTTRLSTQAKNLTQERLEHIRDLRFHVDRQNGEFLDLLDIYYTNAKASGATTNLTIAGQPMTGRYVSTGGGTGGEPVAPYYRVTTGQLIGATDFSQVITAQFLTSNGEAVLSPAGVVNVYDSQVVGSDRPPSLMMGITVITSWTERGQSKRYRTYTQVTESQPELPDIQSQARAVAVELSSTAADGTTLRLQGGIASLDGAQSSGSVVSGLASGAVATRTGNAAVEGRTVEFIAPGSSVERGSAGPTPTGSCSWYAFGNSVVDNANGSIADGLPKAPANIDANAANRVSGQLKATGSSTCGLMEFHNLITPGTARPAPAGLTIGAAPYAIVKEGNETGNADVKGSAYVTSSALTAAQVTKAGANVVMTRPLVLLPNSQDAADGMGLVNVQVTEAKVDCVSGSASALGTVVGSYKLKLRWRGRLTAASGVLSWYEANYDYQSDRAVPLSVTGAAWNPGSYYLSNGAPLSDYVFGAAPGPVTAGATTGARGFPNGIISLTTASTLSNELLAGSSAIKAQLGQLTCVADDQR